MNSTLLPIVAMVATLVGTLGGVLISGLFNARQANANRVASRCDNDRRDAILALAALATALADHRRAMWLREDRRLSGRPYAAERAASHETRSAVTAPLALVCILRPSLAPLAKEAAQATYDLRDAADPQVLAELRRSSLLAADRLLVAASLETAGGAA
jgi:hypothetical protein